MTKDATKVCGKCRTTYPAAYGHTCWQAVPVPTKDDFIHAAIVSGVVDEAAIHDSEAYDRGLMLGRLDGMWDVLCSAGEPLPCHCEHGPNGPPLLRRDLKPWEHEFSCPHYRRAAEPTSLKLADLPAVLLQMLESATALHADDGKVWSYQIYPKDMDALIAQVRRLAAEPNALDAPGGIHGMPEARQGALSEPRAAEPTAECPHCREVYEIWANTEGFTPKTAPESYQQQVIDQMREAAARGLAENRT